ncbi:MAG: polymer-forming cytoskeletal protein [Chlamydiota bacterium]
MFLITTAGGALETSEKESHPEQGQEMNVLPAGMIHQGDYFAFGNSIEISGKVTGDVYAAGSQIVIDGDVDGDVLAIGGSIHIAGTVMRNIRIIGAQVTVSGKVGGAATIVAGNAQLVPSGGIQGNFVATVGNGDIASPIGGTATIVASNLRISSAIQGSLQAYVGHMRLTSRSMVNGDLIYDSDHAAIIESEAKIRGTITYRPSVIQEIFKGRLLNILLIGSKLTGILMNFLYTFVVGWIWLRLYPQNLERALNALTHKPWKAFACGLMLLILLPLASLIFLMSILGAPFAITLLALNVIGFYTAKVLTIFAVSNKMFKRIGLKPNTLSIFCFGLICYFLLTAIPFFGSLLAFSAMIFGLGAVPLAKIHQRQIHS